MSFGDWISSTWIVFFCCNKLFNRNQITLTPQDHISNQISITFSQLELTRNRYFDEIQTNAIIFFFNTALANTNYSITATIDSINSIILVIKEVSENKNDNDDRKKYDEYIVMLSNLIKESEKILASQKTISYIELDNNLETYGNYDGDNNQTTSL